MAFLDFIKNRQEQRPVGEQQSQQQQPETAKQMYSREAAQEKATAPSVRNLSPEQLAEARDIGSKLQPTTSPDPTNPSPSSSAPTEAPSGAPDNQQPMKQLSMSQEKGAPDLSPSSAQLGMKEAELPARPVDTPSPTTSPKPTRSMSPDL